MVAKNLLREWTVIGTPHESPRHLIVSDILDGCIPWRMPLWSLFWTRWSSLLGPSFMGEPRYSSIARMTLRGTGTTTTMPSSPWPLPWTSSLPSLRSPSRIEAISERRSPMYAPRHSITLWRGSAAE